MNKHGSKGILQIRNGDFEADRDAWDFTSGGTSVVAEEKVEIGNKYCKVTATEAIFQTIGLIDGAGYILEFSYRGVAGGTVAIAKHNTNDPPYASQTIPPVTGRDWRRSLYTLTPDSSWAGPLMLHFRAGATVNQFLELDNITLVEISKVEALR